MSHVIRALALGAAISTAGVASADSIIFSDGDFEPGSWSLLTPFWGLPPDNGESMSIVTDRFIGGNPENRFMAQFFTMNIPQGAFNVAFAPVMMNDFVYDPSSQGAITEIAASILTMPIADGLPDHWGGSRMYIEQNGRLYVHASAPNWAGMHFGDPATVRNFSGYGASDFNEVIPNVGFDLDSHPDFAGSSMRFGFGLSLTSTFLNGNGQVLIAGGFDNVSVRLETIPAPGAIALLGLAGLTGTRRRRRN